MKRARGIKKIFTEQIHKRCKGRLIVVSDGDVVEIYCKKCLARWGTEIRIKLPDDWRDGDNLIEH